MTISKAVQQAMTGASWIRKMFTEGIRLKQELGAENVADLSLGNPVLEPPAEVEARLRELAQSPAGGWHRYMPNAGYPSTRAAIAGYLEKHTGVPYTGDHLVMTVGAGGGLNVAFKGLLDHGDEVICLTPYFVEYRFYITNHGGSIVLVPTDAGFRPDAEAIRAAITPKTRAVVVNSPNNPSGVVYSEADYDALAAVLTEASAEQGRPIYLITDEPYRAIAYDGVDVPWVQKHYRDTIHITSFSKDLAMPGERIGYIAVNPASEGAAELVGAFTFANRVLGFVNAPALQQRLIEGLLDVTVDLSGYADKRSRLMAALDEAGYETVRPDGAFYIFPKVPGGMDDVEFVNLCLEERMLVVPGSGFGTPGHFRLSYAVTDRDIDIAVDALKRVAERVAAAS
ncbi:MAG: pyridoxal phosphate-dependent aminotransferase [Planctomycetota bacterium]|nr:pyridoxal phosphate-dependent aminotransferase [Planctomycetota bacterium]